MCRKAGRKRQGDEEEAGTHPAGRNVLPSAVYKRISATQHTLAGCPASCSCAMTSSPGTRPDHCPTRHQDPSATQHTLAGWPASLSCAMTSAAGTRLNHRPACRPSATQHTLAGCPASLSCAMTSSAGTRSSQPDSTTRLQLQGSGGRHFHTAGLQSAAAILQLVLQGPDRQRQAAQPG